MILSALKLFNFRNYKTLNIEPSSNINILYGKNASGKTNLLEAIFLATEAKSFKNAKDEEIINFDENEASVISNFSDGEIAEKYSVEIFKTENKKIYLNEKIVTKKRFREDKSAVIFSPIDLNMIKYSPQDRRRFIDFLISNIDPNYDYYLGVYRRLMMERNKLLKNKLDMNLLDVYNIEIAKVGSKIIIIRLSIIKKLNYFAKIHYNNISNRDIFNMTYLSTLPLADTEEDINKSYIKYLENSLNRDLEKRFTTIGPHRDDIDFKINKKSAKLYASQGEQRSIVLSLKLAQTDLIESIKKHKSILLLDDVFSELDEYRSKYLINSILNIQTFITTTEVMENLKKLDAKFYKIEKGKIEF